MPIPEIEQPEIIIVDEHLRLRKYDGIYDFAFDWYQDPETVRLVDGVSEPYSRNKLKGMYEYLNAHGELYFIELLRYGQYVPIGDVSFWQEDMPMVIGEKTCRGQKIGQKVIRALIRRGKELGYDTLYVNEIYDYNSVSRKCYESAGFQAYIKREKGYGYRLQLTESDTVKNEPSRLI